MKMNAIHLGDADRDIAGWLEEDPIDNDRRWFERYPLETVRHRPVTQIELETCFADRLAHLATEDDLIVVKVTKLADGVRMREAFVIRPITDDEGEEVNDHPKA